MTRVRLDPLEAQRRIRECRKRWLEAHKDELAEKRRADPELYNAKRREHYHAKMNMLIESGVFTPTKPGRKRLYTPEEAVEVAKRQRHESYMRRKERIEAGQALLAASETQS